MSKLAIVLAVSCVTALAQSASQQSASGGSTGQSPSPASSSATKPAAKKSSNASQRGGKKTSRRRKSARVKGQQKIDSERARSIQEALIREHYLSGEPSGTWNQTSEDAMRKYQADHGWQSKTVPDSRALISLGLGPSHDHLLNPDSAMTTSAGASHVPTPAPASQTATPASSTPTPSTAPSAPPSPQ